MQLLWWEQALSDLADLQRWDDWSKHRCHVAVRCFSISEGAFLSGPLLALGGSAGPVFSLVYNWKGWTDKNFIRRTQPLSATMRALQHSVQAEGVIQSLKGQSLSSMKRIRSCVSRPPITRCSSSEVLRHPGKTATAPTRRDLEEHRRSVGICLVNNSGLVFAARCCSAPRHTRPCLSVLYNAFSLVCSVLEFAASSISLRDQLHQASWCWCTGEWMTNMAHGRCHR